MDSHQSFYDYSIMQVGAERQQLQNHSIRSTSTNSLMKCTMKIFNLLRVLLVYILKAVFSVSKKLVPFLCIRIKEAVILLIKTVWSYLWKLWNKKEKAVRRKFQRFSRQKGRKIVSPYCSKEMVDGFEKLVKELTPTEAYMKEGKKTAQKIFDQLKRKAHEYGLKIGKTKIAGSFGKETGISYRVENGNIKNPDLDLVVFVNDMKPPFILAFQVFKIILESMGNVRNVFVRKLSESFTISTSQGDIKVDLLVSTNRTKNTATLPGQDIGNLEANLAMKTLTKMQMKSYHETNTIDQDANKLYSSAFAEKTVHIIRKHTRDPFILKIVKLAKFWTAGLALEPECRPARSCMIETIAIHSQSWVRGGNEQRCVVSGFRRFLEAISNLTTLDIFWNGQTNNHYENGLPSNYTMPMIRDPVNQWNNLAHGLHPAVLSVLISQAKKTLSVLDRRKSSVHYKSVENAIDEIFCHKE